MDGSPFNQYSLTTPAEAHGPFVFHANHLVIENVRYAAFPIALLCGRLASFPENVPGTQAAPLLAAFTNPPVAATLLLAGQQDTPHAMQVRQMIEEQRGEVGRGWHGEDAETGIYECLGPDGRGCRVRNVYAIGNCRMAMVSRPCECGNTIGGAKHRSAANNRQLSWQEAEALAAVAGGFDTEDVPTDPLFRLRDLSSFGYRVIALFQLMPLLIRKHQPAPAVAGRMQEWYADRFDAHFKVFQGITSLGKDDAVLLLAKIACTMSRDFLAQASGNVTDQRRTQYEKQFQQVIRNAVSPNARADPPASRFAAIVAEMKASNAKSEPSVFDELSEAAVAKLEKSNPGGLLKRIRKFGSADQLPIPPKGFSRNTGRDLRGAIWKELSAKDQKLLPFFRVRKLTLYTNSNYRQNYNVRGINYYPCGD
jgi:hypothetical protein